MTVRGRSYHMTHIIWLICDHFDRISWRWTMKVSIFSNNLVIFRCNGLKQTSNGHSIPYLVILTDSRSKYIIKVTSKGVKLFKLWLFCQSGRIWPATDSQYMVSLLLLIINVYKWWKWRRMVCDSVVWLWKDRSLTTSGLLSVLGWSNVVWPIGNLNVGKFLFLKVVWCTKQLFATREITWKCLHHW